MNFEVGAAASRAAQVPKMPVIPVLVGDATWADVPVFFRNRAGIDARKLKPEEVAAKIREAVVKHEAAPAAG
jgi:hypothetical protein